MDITSQNFDGGLQTMLECLAGSHFVSFDLELSGVPHPSSGLDTLQERYHAIKTAAEKYSAIQIGFTIVRKDPKLEEGYVSYPFNMYLKPVIGEKLDVQRNLTLSGRSAEFLIKKGFNMQSLYRDGVPYLSQREINKAEKKENEKGENPVASVLNLKPEDVEARAFMDKVRHRINNWYKMLHRSHELLVSHDQYLTTRDPDYGLSRFEKRLVYHIVKTEYPQLTAAPHGGAVEITEFDGAHEEALKKQRRAAFEEYLQMQMGLGWFVVALRRGPLEQLDIIQVITRSTSQPVLIDVERSTEEFMALCRRIRETKIVLVGHNLFLDLVFLYRTFFGHLPGHVEEFCDLIHELFPHILDTKFMATSANYRRSNSSLEDVDREYAQQLRPKIGITSPEFCKYALRAFPHEAGYDSYLTARVFVRMSAYLAARDARANPAPMPATIKPQTSSQETAAQVSQEHGQAFSPSKLRQDPRPSFPESGIRADPRPSFSALGIQALNLNNLIDYGPEDTLEPQQATAPATKQDPIERKETPVSRMYVNQGLLTQREEKVATPSRPSEAAAPLQIALTIPEWHEEFWQKYGNMLRVYGTEEGELKLGPFEA